MELDAKNLIVSEMTSALLGARDFNKLARQSVNLIVEKFAKYNVVGAGIFRVDSRSGRLLAQAYASRHQRLVEKVIPNSKFAALNISLEEKDNLMVKTVVSDRAQSSGRASDFSKGVVPPLLADTVQKLVGVDCSVALPVCMPNGKSAGAILLALNHATLSADQLLVFEAFAKQLGLAIANVYEFEKLQAKYEKSMKRSALNTLEKDTIPNIKFTLRLTLRQRENLERLAKEQGKTQSDIIRQWLDNQRS